MYCETVYWHRLIYSSIFKNPASSRAISAEVYVQFLSGVLRRSRPVSRLVTYA